MKERIIAAFLLCLAGLTIFAIATKLPKKEYARPATDFSEAPKNNSSAASSGSSPQAPAVSSEVIRLHILAASDSDRDQNIKLALRDLLLPYLNAATIDSRTKTDAMEALTRQCQFFTTLLNNALAQYAVDYTANVTIERIYFPIRIYGSQTYLSKDAVIFPPGYYDSVQVVLGSGEGHNWWCLAYPSLCFLDSAYEYVPKDSASYRLKLGTVEHSVLKKLFYEAPEEEEEISVYCDSKLYELWKLMLDKLHLVKR